MKPRHQLKVAAAPIVLGPDSLVTMSRERAEARRDPAQMRLIAWEYAVRPNRKIMDETAAALRRFDARRWADLHLPLAVWIVTTEDGVMSPDDQRASAASLGIPTVEVPFEHRFTAKSAPQLGAIVESAVDEWSRHLPIGIRPRASRPKS